MYNEIIKMPNMKDRKECIAKDEKIPGKKKNKQVKSREKKLKSRLDALDIQFRKQVKFRSNTIASMLHLAKSVFERDDTTLDERSSAIILLSEATKLDGMPKYMYRYNWEDRIKTGDIPYQFEYLNYDGYLIGLPGIENTGYGVMITEKKIKKKNGIVIVADPKKKYVNIKTVVVEVPRVLQDEETWNNFRKRVQFHTDSMDHIVYVSFNEEIGDTPIWLDCHVSEFIGGTASDFDGDTFETDNSKNVEENDEENGSEEDLTAKTDDSDGLFNKMNETISYLNSLSELEGWSAWHGTEYRRTDSNDSIAVIVPDKLSGAGTATWYDLFDPTYEKPKHIDLISRHVEAVLKDKYVFSISYPTKIEIEDEIFEADAHAWIDHPDTEKCGFAYTKNRNVTHFRKNMKLAIFPMITITEKSDNT